MYQIACKRFVSISLAVAMTAVPLPSISAPPSNTAAVAARDGCANQWMFNGVWRLRVTGFAPYIDPIRQTQTGWQATEQWRNGTDRTLSPTSDSFTLSQQIVLQNGDRIGAWDSTTSTLSQQQVDYHQFPPAAQMTHVQSFFALNADPNNKPVAVIIAFDTAKLQQYPAHPAFSTHPANYRVKFDCSPSELAQGGAQGGAFEVKAHEGCLNQWLSNGLWRVRIAKLEAAMDPSTNQQNGWLVTQQWTNLTGKTSMQVNTSVMDQQIVLQNGDTVSTGYATTTTLNFQQLAYHSFTPGASFSHTQRFYAGPTFDASNKPIKLLIMFDAKNQARNADALQFRSGPANIRVRLDCTK